MSVQCHSCIGGTNVGEDIRKLDYGQHVISGTPGRVSDMIKRGNLRTRAIRMLVLDEADEMLNKGFKEQIYDVYRYLPPDTQVGVASGHACVLVYINVYQCPITTHKCVCVYMCACVCVCVHVSISMCTYVCDAGMVLCTTTQCTCVYVHTYVRIVMH